MVYDSILADSGWFPARLPKAYLLMVVYKLQLPPPKKKLKVSGTRFELWTAMCFCTILLVLQRPSRIHFQTHCTCAVTKEDTRCPANSSVWTIWLNQPSEQESQTNMTAIYAPKSVKYTPNLPLLCILYTLHCRQKWQVPLYHGQLVGSTPPSSSFSFPLASLVPSSLAPHLTCWGNGHHQ